MSNLFLKQSKVDIKVIFRNGSSFEYTHYGTVRDLLDETQDLLEAKKKDWVPGELYHFGQWSFDLSKVMALYVGDIHSANNVPEVEGQWTQ